jgi:hypothetical protein
MGTAGAMSTKKVKSLNDPRLKKEREVYGKFFNKVYKAGPTVGPAFEPDPEAELTDVRRGYVKRTGRNDLKPVEQTGLFKTLTEKQKKRYYKLNPSERPKVDEDENFTLGKKTLLGN